MNNTVIGVLTLLLTGCVDFHADRRVLVDQPFMLSRTPYTIQPGVPLRAIGPFNQLCLQLPTEYHLGSGDFGPNMWMVRRPDGKFVSPKVVMIAPNEHREPFPFMAFLSSSEICFETRPERDLDRRYERIELRADDSLRVLRVRWDAGKRYASL